MGFKTGVEPLDELFRDGIPAGYFVLLEGNLGVGKSLFAYSMAAAAASSGAGVLFFAVDSMADEALEELTRRGVPPERVTVVDCFVPPNEKYAKLKPPFKHRLDSLDALSLANKLSEFVDWFKEGVVVIDSLNEVLMRSLGYVGDLFRSLKIFARRTESVVVATAHTDVEEVYGALVAAEHLADVIIRLEVDPQLEEIGLYVRRMRVARARGLKVAHDWIHFKTVNGRVAEIDVKTMIKMLNKQLMELGLQPKR